jgi:hypothetical protein
MNALKVALDCFGSPSRQLPLTIGQLRPEGIIAFYDFAGAIGRHSLPFVDHEPCLAGLCAFLHLSRSWRLQSVAPRRPSAIAAAALFRHSAVYRPSKQSSTVGIAGTTTARTAPAIIRAATSGTMVLVGAARSLRSLGRRSGAISTAASSLRIPRRETPSIPALRSAVVHGSAKLAQPALVPRRVSTPALRPSPPALPAADSVVASAAAIFISSTAPEFPISARLSHPALLGAAVCMDLAGPQERASARQPPQALRASGPSMPAAGWGPHTSARQPRQVLQAAGFMALEGLELSRAAGRGSDKAASGIAERAGRSLPFSRSKGTREAPRDRPRTGPCLRGRRRFRRRSRWCRRDSPASCSLYRRRSRASPGHILAPQALPPRSSSDLETLS